MPQLVAIITRDLTWVLLITLLFLASDLYRIDSGGRGGGFLEFLEILLFPIVLLFLIPPGLIGRLGILSGSGRRSLLGFVPASHHPLRLDFVRGGVRWSIPSETTQISLPHVGTWA